MNNDELLAVLRKMVVEMGTQKKVAEHLEISEAYFSDILTSRRPISDEMAQKLGYRRVMNYEKMEGS